MRQHRHDTPEWADAVFERWHRRYRVFPIERLQRALIEAVEPIVHPILRWLERRLA
jgi:hypothetical protein